MNLNRMKKLLFVGSLVLLISCSSKQPEARKPVSYSSGSFLEASAAKNKKIAAEEKKTILQIIERNKNLEYNTSDNGFWYTYQVKSPKSDTIYPKKGDLVIFEYNLIELDGDTIYTTEEIGVREYYIDQERIFSGMRQGLKLMQEGETVTFLFPSYKAFGYYGDLDRIGKNVPLQSTVTLKSINTN